MDRLTEFYVRAENALATMADAEDGATAVEYGLIIALIAAVIVAVVATLGTKITAAFSTVANKL
jgi:pilus assembly protein Flp/PilA